MPHTFSMVKSIYFTFLLLFVQCAFAAEPAFEGYQKFILGGQHVGYVVQRFVIDDKKKEMTSIYYAYVKTPVNSTTESLVAKSDLSFEPLSYQYSAVVDGKIVAIDATFKNKKMTGKMTSNGHTQTLSAKVPQNGFLSTFLPYVILKNGMMVGKNYEYYAFAEEAPACSKKDISCDRQNTGFVRGSAAIKAEQKYKGVDSYKVDFNYKKIQFVGILSAKGEALASISPLQDATTELVATKDEAVRNFPFNLKHIKSLFGDIPAGKKNSLNEPKPEPSLPRMPPAEVKAGISLQPTDKSPTEKMGQ